jgi:hypothetical protein
LYLRFGGTDYALDEWQRVVTGLEREALALMARRVPTDSATISLQPCDGRRQAAKLRK